MKTTNVRAPTAPREHAQEVEVARSYAARWGSAIERTLREGLARELMPGTLFRQPLEYVFASGGKRYRPLLTLAACELVGGDPSLALEAGCAIEYLHTSSLLLDDLPCMDGAVERRGRRALHQVVGEAETILVSLVLINTAHQILARTGPADAGARERFHGRICHLIGPEGMIGGQQVDLWIARGAVLPSARGHEGQWLRKTSALITAALLAGAQVGEASVEQMQALECFGRELGEAYQLADDALDVEEDRGRSHTSLNYAERAHERLWNAIEILQEGFAGSAGFLTMAALAAVCVHRTA
jgi:geranylgeranyl diphosphate synthase type II